MTLLVQQATDSDAQTIKDILAHAVNHKLLRGDDSWGFMSYEGEDIENSIRDNTAYLAVLDGKIVGTFVLLWQDDATWGSQPNNAAYVQRLAVGGNWHKLNIGAEILDAISRYVAPFGRTHLRLTCSSENKKLCSYYENLGFVRADSVARPQYSSKPTSYFERSISQNS